VPLIHHRILPTLVRDRRQNDNRPSEGLPRPHGWPTQILVAHSGTDRLVRPVLDLGDLHVGAAHDFTHVPHHLGRLQCILEHRTLLVGLLAGLRGLDGHSCVVLAGHAEFGGGRWVEDRPLHLLLESDCVHSGDALPADQLDSSPVVLPGQCHDMEHHVRHQGIQGIPQFVRRKVHGLHHLNSISGIRISYHYLYQSLVLLNSGGI